MADKAAVLVVRLARNHPLPDGNKRLAWQALTMFCALNGHRLEVPADEAVGMTLTIAAGGLTEAAVAEWLSGRIIPPVAQAGWVEHEVEGSDRQGPCPLDGQGRLVGCWSRAHIEEAALAPHRPVVRVGTLGFALLFALAACSTAPEGASSTTTTTTAAPEVWGVLTGELNVSFPLGGGQVTVNAATVRLDDGQVVEASVPKGFANFLVGGARTRVVPSSGQYAWTIVEVEGAPTTATSVSATTTGGTTRPPGVIVGTTDTVGAPTGPEGHGPDIARLVIDGFSSIDGWVETPRDFIEAALFTGEIDVAAEIVITDDRIGNLASDPTYCIGEMLVVAPGNPLGLTDYESVAVAGARIGAIEEDPYQAGYLRAAGVHDDDLVLFSFSTLEDWYEAVSKGEIDAIALLGSAPIWGDFAPQVARPELETTPVFFPVDESGEEVLWCYGLAVYDITLRGAVDDEIARLHSNGELAALLAGYGLDPIQAARAAALTVADVLAGPTR